MTRDAERRPDDRSECDLASSRWPARRSLALVVGASTVLWALILLPFITLG